MGALANALAWSARGIDTAEDKLGGEGRNSDDGKLNPRERERDRGKRWGVALLTLR